MLLGRVAKSGHHVLHFVMRVAKIKPAILRDVILPIAAPAMSRVLQKGCSV